MTRTAHAAIVMAALLSTIAAPAFGADLLVLADVLDVCAAEGAELEESESSISSHLATTATRREPSHRRWFAVVKQRPPASLSVRPGAFPNVALSRNLASLCSRRLC